MRFTLSIFGRLSSLPFSPRSFVHRDKLTLCVWDVPKLFSRGDGWTYFNSLTTVVELSIRNSSQFYIITTDHIELKREHFTNLWEIIPNTIYYWVLVLQSAPMGAYYSIISFKILNFSYSAPLKCNEYIEVFFKISLETLLRKLRYEWIINIDYYYTYSYDIQ